MFPVPAVSWGGASIWTILMLRLVESRTVPPRQKARLGTGRSRLARPETVEKVAKALWLAGGLPSGERRRCRGPITQGKCRLVAPHQALAVTARSGWC